MRSNSCQSVYMALSQVCRGGCSSACASSLIAAILDFLFHQLPFLDQTSSVFNKTESDPVRISGKQQCLFCKGLFGLLSLAGSVQGKYTVAVSYLQMLFPICTVCYLKRLVTVESNFIEIRKALIKTNNEFFC